MFHNSLNRKFLEIRKELGFLEALADQITNDPMVFSDPTIWWSYNQSLGSGLHNLYEGMEKMFSAIARDFDETSPAGQQSHADLLEQMAAQGRSLEDGSVTRPAVISDELYELLKTHLLGYRHYFRHNYGLQEHLSFTLENVDRAHKAVILLARDFHAFYRDIFSNPELTFENVSGDPVPPEETTTMEEDRARLEQIIQSRRTGDSHNH